MTAIQYFRSNSQKLKNPFVSVWKTDNLGLSANNQVRLPLTVAGTHGTYDFIVKWGDGTVERITSPGDAKKTHTYASPGTYEISIDGIFRGMNFAAAESGSEGNKILEIKQWGCFQTIGNPVFYGCSNLDVTATDLPDLSLTDNISGFFRGCVNLVGNSSFEDWDVYHIKHFGTGNNGTFRSCPLFNQDISGWDTISGESMNENFFNASSFNRNLGSWNMSKVTVAQNMLRGTAMSVENYSNTLIGWASQNLKTGVSFRADPCKYNPAGATARQYIIDTFNWTIIDGGPA